MDVIFASSTKPCQRGDGACDAHAGAIERLSAYDGGHAHVMAVCASDYMRTRLRFERACAASYSVHAAAHAHSWSVQVALEATDCDDECERKEASVLGNIVNQSLCFILRHYA